MARYPDLYSNFTELPTDDDAGENERSAAPAPEAAAEAAASDSKA